MDDRASEFVEAWIDDNIHAQAYVAEDGDDPRPGDYATTCLEEAKTAGIPEDEIKAAYPDLSGRMAEAIDAAADQEVDRLASKDD